MKDQGKIDQSTYEASVKEPLHIQSSKPSSSDAIKYPYFIDQVIREASQKYGITENEVLHGGFRIYTTLDRKMQEAGEQVYSQDSLFPSGSSDQLIQSGAVLVDPRDGGIRALIGGRGEQPFRGFNRAVQLKRQPGSTMKPISVYTPALERGYTPDSTLMDEPVNFGGYQPKNAGGSYHGEVSIYEALIHSYNVPAVSLLNEMGIDAGMEAAKRFGIELTDADRTLGLALGGLQEGVSPLDMAEAFGVFANDGTRIPAHSITRIESAEGETTAEFDSNGSVKVTEPAVARTMTAMLEGVVKEGTGDAAALGDRPVAGKTGTTEMPGTGGGMKDNWFVGYTPQLVGAVWLGYDHTDSSHYLTTTSKAAAAVFQKLMGEALQDEPVKAFANVPSIAKKPKDTEKAKEEKEEKKDKEKDKEKKKSEKEKKKEEKKKKRDEEHRGKGKGKKDKNDDD